MDGTTWSASEHTHPESNQGAGVLTVLRSRWVDGTGPGEHRDGARVALVIEGGSSRGAYSSGMVVALEQLGVTGLFDAVYGASAGALNGAWLLCGRAEASMHAWWDPQIMGRVISARHVLRGRPVVDTDYLVHTVYERLVPMDFDAILAGPVALHPTATDAEAGTTVDLAPLIHDRHDLQTALLASTRMPVLGGRPIPLGGRRFIDAGVSESVPIHTALAAGATHVLALRTRRAGEPPRAPMLPERLVVRRYLRRHAPGAVTAWDDRPAARLREEAALAGPHVLQVHPPADSHLVGRTSRKTAMLRKVVELGRRAAYDAVQPVVRPV